MYLKSIEVNGFKSFANKILLEFGGGITAIVGPNGSGKSNVADAVRWVLGEQSAKQLRGSNMQDVIFSGTEARKPQGSAYVAITLDNSDHKLPVEYKEVTVARRVYRSGESEYLMNGSSCRLRDVQELFFDTGIGKEGYSIIGQGQIDRIISGKPEERRELLDEAAGIVKFKKRKAAAEKNLAEEQANLARVADIISEIEKQIGPLERQSAVAKEYLRLKENLKRLEVSWFLVEQEKSGIQKKELEEKKKIAEDDLKETRQTYDNTKAEYERLELELEGHAKRLEQQKEEKASLDVAYEKAEGDIRLLAGQIDGISQNSLLLDKNIEQIQKNMQVKRLDLEKYLIEKEASEGELDTLDDTQSDLVQAIQDIKEEIAKLNKEIENSNAEVFKLLNENAGHKATIQHYQTMKDQNAIKKSGLSRKALENKRLEEQTLVVTKQCARRVERARAEVSAKNQEILILQEDAKKLSEEINGLVRRLEEKQRILLSDSSRLESLRNITERYEGFGTSIRKLMEHKAQYPGIHGVVADLVKVDKNYETAIETALGSSIQNVVTEDEATAKALIELLKKTKSGRATFLPLTSITPQKNKNESALLETGVLGLASSLVKADKRYTNLVQFLLGRIFVVDTIDHALALAKKYGYSLRIVTLEGEQLNPGGSLSGGTYKNSSSLLSRRREMEELTNRIEKERAAVEELENERQKENERLTDLRQEIDQAKEEAKKLFIRQNTAEVALRQQHSELEQLQEQFTKFSEEIQEIGEQMGKFKETIRKLTFEYNKNTARSREKKAQIKKYEKMLEQMQIKEQEQNAELLALKTKFSGLEQNSRNASENIRRVKEEIEEQIAEQGRIRTDLKSQTRIKQEKEKEIVLKKAEQEENRKHAAKLEQSIKQIGEEREKVTGIHKGFFAKREELSDRISRMDKESYRLTGLLERLEEAIEARINYIWEEYELTPSAAAALQEGNTGAAQNTQAKILNSSKKEIAELKGKIKGLGDVNVNAIEDYKQLSERHSFLTSQRNDLKESEQTLLGIISDLESEMKKQFAEKFAEIANQFNTVFKELFGGGRATLELMESEDILEAGIRIIAQPPGKKLQNMMQLSGGEKALTAISLLFAIQNLKPSPFCLLDEIEAALDDSNVKRYAKYLHKLTKDTQFIVITHRRGTMAAADILYGITMQEKGVSTLVSVSLIEGELDK